jgi:hypothetical protein
MSAVLVNVVSPDGAAILEVDHLGGRAHRSREQKEEDDR